MASPTLASGANHIASSLQPHLKAGGGQANIRPSTLYDCADINEQYDAQLREAINRLPDESRTDLKQYKNARAVLVYDALDSSVSSSSSEDITDILLRMMRAKAIKVEQSPPRSFMGALEPYAYTETPSLNRRVTKWLNSTQTSLPPATTSADNRHLSALAISSSNRQASPRTTSPKRKATEPASTVSPSPSKKKKRQSSSYAPPSKYAHLTNLLTDSLAPNLICIFIGVNPGIRTATTGHAYSHPSNLFWKLAHSSGCTPRLCKPEEDQDLPHLYALGHTNIVSRPTKDAAELSSSEMDEGVAILEEKIRKYRPESVAIVGKGIWESIWRVRHGRKCGKDDFRYGWQDEGERMGVVEAEEGEGWLGARVFVATTTSGLAAGMRPHEKEEVWKGLGQWVKLRRMEKGIPDEGGMKVEGVADEAEIPTVKEELAEES